MSQATSPGDDRDPKELSDDELLKRIARRDPEKYPVVKHARRALGWDQDDSGESS